MVSMTLLNYFLDTLPAAMVDLGVGVAQMCGGTLILRRIASSYLTREELESRAPPRNSRLITI